MATRAVFPKLRRLLNTTKLQLSFLSGLEQETTRFWHYGIALLLVVAALGITLLINPLLQDTPSALFYVSVMLSSWFGGFGSGLFATLLSTILLNYFFLEPYHSFNVVELETVVQSSVFAAASILTSYLNESRLKAKRRAETNFKAWRSSESQLTHLAESNIIGIFAANFEGSITNANDAFLQMIGYTREDLLGGRIRWNTMTPPEYQQVSQRSQHELRTVGFCTPFEKEYIRKDGSRVSILLGSVMRDDQTVIGFVLDRSESKRHEAKRQQAENDLRIAEERLRLALNAARMVVWDWDLQTEQVVCSENSEEVWGTQIGTADDFIAAIHPDDRALVAQANLEAQQHEGVFQCEYRVIAPDKTVRWVHSRGRTYFDARGQAERMIGVSVDVSERVRIEAERDALLQQEQSARTEAERANRIKDEFLAVLSHELRSPLNPILGWTKLLQSQKFSPERMAQALATIERNAKLQAQLIEDLLDVSRILQGKMALNVSSVNLATTIEAAIETVRLAAEAKNIQIHTVLASNELIVTGDTARLQQIVWNLLTNAVKFTPQGGRVEVRLDRSDGFAQVQVQDTGKGINPDFLPCVFNYFQQEDGATTRKFGGLGLGLALVQHLTEQHGGTVSAESDGEEQGATFTVRLPLPSPPSKPASEPVPAPPTADLHDLNILVVDDEPDMRDLMVTILEARGAKVKAVACATEALTILEQWQPDLFISDIGMPEIDGYMLMRQIRRSEASQQKSLSAERRGEVPAIALTAYAGELDHQQALAAGFQQHLAKPIEPDQLVNAIASLVSKQPDHPNLT